MLCLLHGPGKIHNGELFTQSSSIFFGQERRWLKKLGFRQKSNDFMNVYKDLGHMQEFPKGLRADTIGKVYCIPYLSVIGKDATIKLRNVFSAPRVQSQAISPDPRLQTHIFDS